MTVSPTSDFRIESSLPRIIRLTAQGIGGPNGGPQSGMRTGADGCLLGGEPNQRRGCSTGIRVQLGMVRIALLSSDPSLWKVAQGAADEFLFALCAICQTNVYISLVCRRSVASWLLSNRPGRTSKAPLLPPLPSQPPLSLWATHPPAEVGHIDGIDSEDVPAAKATRAGSTGRSTRRQRAASASARGMDSADEYASDDAQAIARHAEARFEATCTKIAYKHE